MRSWVNLKSEVEIVYFTGNQCHNEQMQWWFCLTHLEAEAGPGCPDQFRLGPYESEDLARGALARISARNLELDEQETD